MINLFGNHYDTHIDTLILDCIEDEKELSNVKKFGNLKNLVLSNSDIEDEGLKYISKCLTIENLNLQCIPIADKGVEFVSHLINLKYLRLKECDHITNHCVQYLNRLTKLEDLQIQDTNLDQEGLKNLHLPNLKFICLEIWNDNFTPDFLKAFSRQNPACRIVAKGEGEFLNGRYESIG